MKVLHLIHSLDLRGGGIAAGLRELPLNEATLLCLDDPKNPALNNITQPIVALGPTNNHYGYTSKLTPWLNQNLHKFDAAVIHGLWQYHGLGFLRAKRPSKFPFYVFAHGMMDPWFSKAYPFKRLKKSIYWNLFEKHLIHKAKGLFFTSEDELKKSSAFSQSFKGQKRITAYGISTPNINETEAKAAFLNKNPLLKNQRVLLFFSRIHPKKGVHFLIKAWNQFWETRPAHSTEEWTLVIIGPHAPSEAHYYKQLKATATQAKKAIIFIDFLDELARWGALCAADFFILPSHQENFGMAVIESLAAGTPVLISREVNTWQIITQSNAGWADSDTLEGTLRLIQVAIEMPESALPTFKENARLCFKQNFDLNYLPNTLHGMIKQDLEKIK